MMYKKLTQYRALLLFTVLLAGTNALATPNPDERTIVLTNFEEKNVADDWETVNDNVMGGRSSGYPRFWRGGKNKLLPI